MTYELMSDIFFVFSIAWFLFASVYLITIAIPYFFRENLTADMASNDIDLPKLSVIIPARNEELNIEECLDGILDQSYPTDKMEIIVVDDASTDNTFELAKAYINKYKNIKLLKAPEKPDDWMGKNSACWHGAKSATGSWYCFIDSDTIAEKDLMKSAVSFAVKNEIHLFSLIPFQLIISFVERLFLPTIFMSIASYMRFKQVNDPNSEEAIANGQFLLFDKKVYDEIDGHQGIKGELMEDIAFAKKIKLSGFKLYWLFGFDLVKTRMYRNFSHIWEGFSKNLSEIIARDNFIHTVLAPVKSILLGWMTIIAPIVSLNLLLGGGYSTLNVISFVLNFSVFVSILLSVIMTLRALKVPVIYSLAFPLGFTLQAIIYIKSLINSKIGKKKWKGRTYSS